MILKWSRRTLFLLIVLASLYASLQNLLSTKDLGHINEDPVAAWEKRFEPLKERLPFTRGVVGYIIDSDIPGVNYDAADEEGEYVLVQYAMSPIILVRGTDQEWNIGNLSRQAYEAWSQSNHGRFEVIPFKGNLYLIHRVGQ